MKFFGFIALVSLAANLFAAELQKIPGCTLVPSEWADGDSFPVKFPDGSVKNIRLYGADCIELHVTGNESNTRRLRDQRRYFGIDDILVAKSFGEAAKAETGRVLAEPFTVFTLLADARGDSRFPRFYGFVVTSDGKNLSEWLVSQGLARAFGMIRQEPGGSSGAEWRERLADLELLAARAGNGAWSRTNWEKLPGIREEARRETAELDTARGSQKVSEGNLFDLNSASRDELMTLPSIGEKTAQLIIQGRPFRSVNDLLTIRGIGPSTLLKIRKHLTVVQKPSE